MINTKILQPILIAVLISFISACASTGVTVKDVRSIDNRVLVSESRSDVIDFARKFEAAINAKDTQFVGDKLLPQSELDEMVADEKDENVKLFMSGFMENVKIGVLNILMQDDSSMEFLRAYEGADNYNFVYAMDLQGGDDYDFIEFLFDKETLEFQDFFSYTSYMNFEQSFEDMGLVLSAILKDDEDGKKISAISQMDSCEDVINAYENLRVEFQNIRKQYLRYSNCALSTDPDAYYADVVKVFERIAKSNTDMPFSRTLFAVIEGDLNKAHSYIDLVSDEVGGDVRLDLYKFMLALEFGENALAKNILADALQKYPNSENVYFSSMDYYLAQNNYAKLLSVFLYMNEAFGYNYSPELIRGFEGFEGFVESQEFLDWEKSQ